MLRCQPTDCGRGDHIRACDCPHERRSVATPLFARGACRPTLRFPTPPASPAAFLLLALFRSHASKYLGNANGDPVNPKVASSSPVRGAKFVRYENSPPSGSIKED